MDKPHSQTDFGAETGTALEPVVVFYTKQSPDGLRMPTLWELLSTYRRVRRGWGRGEVREGQGMGVVGVGEWQGGGW